MKTLRLNSAAVALLVLLGIASGCSQKKPVLVVPQQPPTAAPQPTPTPEPEVAQQPAEQQPQEAQQPAAPSADQNKASAEKKPKQSRRTAKKSSSTTPAGNEKSTNEVAHNTTKRVIPAGKPEPTPVAGEISAGPTPVDPAHSQVSTEQLLQGAESNLNGITRQLSKDEEAMRAQIRDFIKQSRNATTENDPTRAHNWAVKARLLSDELIKQK